MLLVSLFLPAARQAHGLPLPVMHVSYLFPGILRLLHVARHNGRLDGQYRVSPSARHACVVPLSRRTVSCMLLGVRRALTGSSVFCLFQGHKRVSVLASYVSRLLPLARLDCLLSFSGHMQPSLQQAWSLRKQDTAPQSIAIVLFFLQHYLKK